MREGGRICGTLRYIDNLLTTAWCTASQKHFHCGYTKVPQTSKGQLEVPYHIKEILYFNYTIPRRCAGSITPTLHSHKQ